MQGSKFKHQRHFPSSNGGSGNKVSERSVIGSHNTKIDGQTVLSPLTTPDSSNEHGDNGTWHEQRKTGSRNQRYEVNKEIKIHHKAKHRRSYDTA